MSRKLICIVLAVLMVLSILSGCKKNEEGPDDEKIEILPAGDVIDKYKKDPVDHSKEPLAPTKILRLHYRRNDDTNNDRASYVPWNIWAWDMDNGGNGEAYEFTGYDDYGVYVDLDLNVISEGKGTREVGFLVRTDNWNKDPD